MVTKKDIINGLYELGLKSGDTVVVHSSLSSFGQVKGDADTVIDAILEVVGSEGTLVVPTFTYGQGVFDPQESPSLTGAITQTLRKRPNAIRSLHPSHSVAAIGRLAEVITENVENFCPFGRGSSLFKLLQVNGKVLLLGTTHITNSIIHVAEEIVSVVYLERNREVQFKNPHGTVVRKWIRMPGCSKGFDAVQEILEERDAIKETQIGDCNAMLMTARSVVDAAVEVLKLNPEGLLCEHPDCESCAQARAMISATEAEMQEKEIIELAEEEERTRRFVEKSLEGNPVKYFDPDEEYYSPN